MSKVAVGCPPSGVRTDDVNKLRRCVVGADVMMRTISPRLARGVKGKGGGKVVRGQYPRSCEAVKTH